MSKTSKSTRQILRVAYELGNEELPKYSHSYSPQKFTMAQLFACLVLKSSLKLDYRGVVELLNDSPELRKVIGAEKGISPIFR